MRVRFTPRARRDLATILSYLDEHSPQGARTVQRAIQHTIDLIGQAPESGRRAGVQDTRVLPAGRSPYLIYWTIEWGEVWLIHIRLARAGRGKEGTNESHSEIMPTLIVWPHLASIG